jgi:hypothetical protein
MGDHPERTVRAWPVPAMSGVVPRAQRATFESDDFKLASSRDLLVSGIVCGEAVSAPVDHPLADRAEAIQPPSFGRERK